MKLANKVAWITGGTNDGVIFTMLAPKVGALTSLVTLSRSIWASLGLRSPNPWLSSCVRAWRAALRSAISAIAERYTTTYVVDYQILMKRRDRQSHRQYPMFDREEDLYPLVPRMSDTLTQKSTALYRGSAALTNVLHPITRSKVADLVRLMNGYYSNLIEGYRTRPAELAEALRGRFSENAEARRNQELAIRHYKTMVAFEEHVRAVDDVFAPVFLRQIHANLWVAPNDYDGSEPGPGEFRKSNVAVGQHLAPSWQAIPQMLERFGTEYRNATQPGGRPEALIAAVAAHQRLSFIHPFSDYNGRVARFQTHASLIKVGVDGSGLWTLSRGLARNKNQYFQSLSKADEKRWNDYDGRGPRSERALHEFCEIMLDIALGQVAFMGNLLDLQGLLTRVTGYCQLREAQKSLPERSFAVMKTALATGEISRGEVAGLIDKSSRTAQSVVAKLLQEGLLTSPSPKGPLQVGFPPHAAAAFFPDLFPSGDVAIPQEVTENEKTVATWRADSRDKEHLQRGAGRPGDG